MNTQQADIRGFRERLGMLGQAAPADGLSDQQRLKRARQTFMEKLDGRMAVDLETCIHCGMCAEACHFYIATEDERYSPVHKFDPLRRFYRRELSPMRWLYKPFTKAITIQDLAEWKELVFEACTSCGRCDMICPMGIKLSNLINLMRKGLASAGMVPDELRALQAEQLEKKTVFGVGADQLREVAADLPLDKSPADVLLLTTAVEVLLFPGSIAAYAKILNKSGANWTMSTGAFEAANLGLISGDLATRKTAVTRIVEAAKAAGVKTIVLPESGHAYQALRWEAAGEIGKELPFEVVAISEYIAGEVDAGRLSLKPSANGGSVTYHDPCRLARHGGVFEEPRSLLRALGLDVRETDSNRRENLCCGGGCGEYVIGHAAPLRQKAFELKRHEFDDTKADTVVTGCANCRVNLMIGADESGWQTPVASLAETVADNLAD